MNHNHKNGAVNQLREFIVLTNDGSQHQIQAADEIEAGYRGLWLVGAENLKDVQPL